MKVVLDNNIILDALIPNPEFEVQAQKILRLAFEKSIKGFVNTNSISDMFYVLRKTYGASISKSMLIKLVKNLDIIGVEAVDTITALNSPQNDLEDVIIVVCAKKINADYIVSRDEKFIKEKTEIKVIAPSKLLELVLQGE